MVSFVRSNVQSTVGFLRDMRRLNVALTRAKRTLIMIGHAQTLSAHPGNRSCALCACTYILHAL